MLWMSIMLSHSVLLGQNHRNLNCISMHIFGFCTPKICIETQFKFLWFWPSKTSLWDSMMLILAPREILYTGPLIVSEFEGCTVKVAQATWQLWRNNGRREWVKNTSYIVLSYEFYLYLNSKASFERMKGFCYEYAKLLKLISTWPN